VICEYCDEEVLPEEVLSEGRLNGKPVHRECLFRITNGSVAHVLKECECFGGTRSDPPGMSRREAAKLALDTFLIINGHKKVG
jgi:hypothetical protein